MPGEEIAIILGAAILSVAGVGFAAFAAATARSAADIIGVIAGIVLLLVAGLHLAPEAIRSGGVEFAFLICGATAGVTIELAFRSPGAQGSTEMARLAARVGILVLALHSMLDGAIYTAAFWHGHDTGLFASLGLVLHEAPEGVVALLLGLQAGLRPGGAVAAALLASTATTPLGWALAHALEGAGESVMRPMFAASAGLLLYVGWHLIAGGLRGIRARRG